MNSQCLVVIQTHNLVVVTLCASFCVIYSTIQQTDGTFYIVRWVVMTHDEYEHLFALFFAEAVVERITLLDASLLKYAVAVFYQYGGNLHSTTTLAWTPAPAPCSMPLTSCRTPLSHRWSRSATHPSTAA